MMPQVVFFVFFSREHVGSIVRFWSCLLRYFDHVSSRQYQPTNCWNCGGGQVWKNPQSLKYPAPIIRSSWFSRDDSGIEQPTMIDPWPAVSGPSPPCDEVLNKLDSRWSHNCTSSPWHNAARLRNPKNPWWASLGWFGARRFDGWSP